MSASTPRWRALVLLLLGLLAAVGNAESSIKDTPKYGLTDKHEKGRCAMRGTCGRQGFFGSELPCPDNGIAEAPDADTKKKLLDICGEKWDGSDICCLEEQLDALQENLKRADPIISGCPACKENFVNLFCTFTCSPDQSTFVNVTKTEPKGDKKLVTELDQLISTEYGSGFYNSCKDVKFGPTNSRAMDFIGGGAKNYTHFLKFLGDKKFLGSPFQINFPIPDKDEFPKMEPMHDSPFPCNSTDEQYRCACVDCEGSCAALPAVSEEQFCHVGALPCLSFAVIIVYSVFLLLLIIAVSGHVAYQKHSQSKNERLRLLQDAAPSDDEDEGDVVHNAGMLDRPQKYYWLNTLCDAGFSRLGRVCARFPAITISTSILIVVLLSLGWLRFAVETDPVRLWVSPDSEAAKEKAFFDNNFGPFYRAQQAFLVNDLSDAGPQPVLTYETLSWWFDVEARVQRLKSLDGGVTFDDVCFKPTGDACVVQSVSGYFGGPFTHIDPETWKGNLQDCTDNPVSCLPDFQQPLQPVMLFGGVDEEVLDAKALIVTWVVNNHAEGTEELDKAMDWEDSLKGLLLAIQGEAADRGLRLSFNTEISLEQELNKSTNTDVKIVVISYIVMFIYASLALGSTTVAIRSILHNPANALVQSKFLLGVIGIIIVLMSVSASVGLFSAAGIKVTLIIAEVIPFLVLAVGVDNIFLIVHEFERVNVSHPDGPVSDRVARALGRMGPSILLSATTETVAFALGAAVGMPAVRNFAAYAAGAVFINALLQVTMFVSVLALNQKRVEASRADCIPCIRVRRADSASLSGGMVYGLDDEGSFQRFIRKTYAPALLGKKAKVSILAVFLGIFTAGIALIPQVELGLDQRIAIPSDSYLIPYFNDLYDYFNVGPPVYFVTKDLNVTQRQHQQEICGRYSTCHQYSMANILEQERKRPEYSYIADASASWIDDFFLWLNPTLKRCCYDELPVDPEEDPIPCFADRDPPWNTTLYGMPEGTEFIDYLTRWLEAPTTADCPVAGKAAYGTALVVNSDKTSIPASHFRTSHTPLRSQADFIAAYTSARRIADSISRDQHIDVFPYSKFYIFFDQYLSIVRLSCALLGSALAIILVLTTLLLGSLRTGAVVTVTVAMILVDIAGTMAVAGVSLNAVSLVNLIISVGIGVEFCAHIARAFAFPSATVMERAPRHQFRGRDARAWTSLVNVGGSVFSGITITKLLGVCVLAFTRSKIFEVYYFRVWLALVVWAALHSLVFLPVALSVFGGEGYVDPESSGGLEEDLRSRRYPALLADDEYDSDDF
ncbi:multidrug efflux transporter AcrB transmembrane domain-containing protein [Aulographum hederae CBS 113979]|uniref:Multidrug efflux transporter AcrB transmembrane domain-containing protein n=1 Tax=Aulographum hederae CBS 113979 TaxID=1176131 RepID=A0A6G1GVK4_9PEZI|nr:multidrug efflux transporter AcrB transmembrane domain-containing protein [Aulographum hederae CBS 113979]